MSERLGPKEPPMSEPFPGVRLGPYRINNQQLAYDLIARRGHRMTVEDLALRIGRVTGIDLRYAMQEVDKTPVSHNQTVPKMAIAAARAEISSTGWSTHGIDRIIYMSTYPLESREDVSTQIARDIDGFHIPRTKDVYSACSGSTVAFRYIAEVAHHGQNILLTGAEHYSANMDPVDVNRSIFSDGTVTAAFTYGEDLEIVDMTDLFHEDSDAIMAPVGEAPIDSIYLPVPFAPKFKMKGPEVKLWVLNGEPLEQALELYGRTPKGRGAIYVISHQASGTTLDEYFRRLQEAGIPESAFPPPHVSQIGNLGAVSALAELRALASTTRLRKGDRVIMEAYGAGKTAMGVTILVKKDNLFRPAA